LLFQVLNYDSVTVCDGVLKEIQCPPAENIHVLQGFYGKWRNHDCKGERADPDNLPTCRQERSKTLGIVRDLCHGQNTCTLVADKSVYGQPCPDNKAYLYMTFFCMKNGQKLVHHKSHDQKEVVTVPSHGYIVREEKVRWEEERRKKERDDAKREELVKLKNPNLLNPNPQPESGKQSEEEQHDNKQSINRHRLAKKPATIELNVKDSTPMFSSVEEAVKIENSLDSNSENENKTKHAVKAETRTLNKTSEESPKYKIVDVTQESLLNKEKSMIVDYILKSRIPTHKNHKKVSKVEGDKNTPKHHEREKIHRHESPEPSPAVNIKKKVVSTIKETSEDVIYPYNKLDAISTQLEREGDIILSFPEIYGNF